MDKLVGYVIKIGERYGFDEDVKKLKSSLKIYVWIEILITIVLTLIAIGFLIATVYQNKNLGFAFFIMAFIVFLITILPSAAVATSRSKWNIQICNIAGEPLLTELIIYIFIIFILEGLNYGFSESLIFIFLGLEIIIFSILIFSIFQSRKSGFDMMHVIYKNAYYRNKIDTCAEEAIKNIAEIKQFKKERVYAEYTTIEGLKLHVSYPFKYYKNYNGGIHITAPLQKNAIEKAFLLAKEIEIKCGF